MIVSQGLFNAGVGTVLALVSMNFIEDYLPVTALMRADPVELTETEYTARVSGYKIKGCPVVKDSFIGWQKSDAGWFETGISFPDDPSPNSSNPASYEQLNFGLFKWHGLKIGSEKVRVTVMHNCGGKVVITTVGPFDIENPASEKG